MNDFTVKNSLNSFLANHTFYNFSDVKVFVHQGVVLLVGTVLTNKELDYILTAVKRLPGVKQVICKLSLKPETVTVKLSLLASVLGIF